MKTLQEALESFRDNGGAAQSLRKHLAAAEIIVWDDMTRAKLYDFREEVTGAVAANTARTIFLNAKALINRYKDQIGCLPDDWANILSAKAEKVMRTYLTPDELKAFEAVPCRTNKERVVQLECLLEAYTGARVSDIMSFTYENVQGGFLTYVSKKTKVQASIPVSKKILTWIEYVQANKRYEPSLRGRCDIIRRICERAHIDERVTVFERGETKKGPKWQFITSHSFRISFVTNLQQSGMDLVSISRLSGHKNVAMTERYCAPAKPRLTWAAQEFLGLNEK